MVNGKTTEYFVRGDRYLYNLQGDVAGIVRATTEKLVAIYKYDA